MLALLVKLSETASVAVVLWSVGGGEGARPNAHDQERASLHSTQNCRKSVDLVTFWCGLGCCSHLFYLAALAARSWGQLLRSWGQLLRGSPRPLELLVVPPRCHSGGQQAALRGEQLAARPALPRLVVEPWCRACPNPAQVASTPPARSHPRSKRTWK